MIFNLINAAAALLALGLSGLALYRQRAVAHIEAHPVTVIPQQSVSVEILNSGTRPARGAWCLIACEGKFAICQSGAFLGPGKRARVRTNMQVSRKLGRSNVDGVVGYVDPKGRHVAWPLWGGRRRRFKSGTSFNRIFEAMCPGVDPGTQQETFAGEQVSD